MEVVSSTVWQGLWEELAVSLVWNSIGHVVAPLLVSMAPGPPSSIPWVLRLDLLQTESYLLVFLLYVF